MGLKNHYDAACGVIIPGCFNSCFYFGGMVGIIIHHAYLLIASHKLKSSFSPMIFFDTGLYLFPGQLVFPGHSNRCQRIIGIMPARNRYFCRTDHVPLFVNIKTGTSSLAVPVGKIIITTGVFPIKYYMTVGFVFETQIIGIAAKQQSKPVTIHLSQELSKSFIQFIHRFIIIQMIVFNIGNNSNIGF